MADKAYVIYAEIEDKEGENPKFKIFASEDLETRAESLVEDMTAALSDAHENTTISFIEVDKNIDSKLASDLITEFNAEASIVFKTDEEVTEPDEVED